jgi:hypothetical protein
VGNAFMCPCGRRELLCGALADERRIASPLTPSGEMEPRRGPLFGKKIYISISFKYSVKGVRR